MATLEQVEKLREKANVSYDDAKEALDATNGDLLEALIYLEKKGKTTPPSSGGFYNSEKSHQECEQLAPKNREKAANDKESFMDLLKKFGRFCAKVIHKGNINFFEVRKGEEVKTVFPITALALLLIFLFWITVPLIVIGLFFGFRYRFRGPDLGIDSVNSAMDNAASTAENLKKSFAGEKK